MEPPEDDVVAEDPPQPTYGQRYRGRWRACFLAFAAVGALVLVVEHSGAMGWTVRQVSALVIDAVVGAVADGLLFGSLACLLVAIPPGRRPKPVR